MLQEFGILEFFREQLIQPNSNKSKTLVGHAEWDLCGAKNCQLVTSDLM